MAGTGLSSNSGSPSKRRFPLFEPWAFFCEPYIRRSIAARIRENTIAKGADSTTPLAILA